MVNMATIAEQIEALQRAVHNYISCYQREQAAGWSGGGDAGAAMFNAQGDRMQARSEIVSIGAELAGELEAANHDSTPVLELKTAAEMHGGGPKALIAAWREHKAALERIKLTDTQGKKSNKQPRKKQASKVVSPEAKAQAEHEKLTQRQRLVARARELGNISEAAREEGVKKQTAHDWVKAAGGLTEREPTRDEDYEFSGNPERRSEGQRGRQDPDDIEDW
jgi:hypothetical protein